MLSLREVSWGCPCTGECPRQCAPWKNSSSMSSLFWINSFLIQNHSSIPFIKGRLCEDVPDISTVKLWKCRSPSLPSLWTRGRWQRSRFDRRPEKKKSVIFCRLSIGSPDASCVPAQAADWAPDAAWSSHRGKRKEAATGWDDGGWWAEN